MTPLTSWRRAAGTLALGVLLLAGSARDSEAELYIYCDVELESGFVIAGCVGHDGYPAGMGGCWHFDYWMVVDLWSPSGRSASGGGEIEAMAQLSFLGESGPWALAVEFGVTCLCGGPLYAQPVFAAPQVQPPTPQLTRTPAGQIVRGTNVTFRVTNAAGQPYTATRVFNWQYQTQELGTVTLTQGANQSVPQWPGTMVWSGTLSVNVEGFANPLTMQVTVVPRDWTWQPKSPEERQYPFEVPGTSVTLSVLDAPTAQNEVTRRIGQMHANVPFSWTATQLNSGPNQGFLYVSALNETSGVQVHAYNWIITKGLDGQGTPFFDNQLGTHDPVTNPDGCISGAQLRTNTIRHESGPTISHYPQYTQALANPANNPGALAEPHVSRTSQMTLAAFDEEVLQMLELARDRIEVAANLVEPTPAEVNYDGSGVYRGRINWAPEYNSCQ